MNTAEQASRDFIEGKLDASADAVEAALCAIYDRQTAEERAGKYSIQTNGVGFSKFDAEFCSSLVQQIKRGRHLTPKQLEIGRRKMKRYWRQLITCMTTTVPEPMVDNDRQIIAPSINVNRLPSVAPRVDQVSERASDLYGSW